MTNSLPGLTGLLLAVVALCGTSLAQPAGGNPAPVPAQNVPAAATAPQAEQALQAAIAALDRYDSISAKLRQRAEILGRKIEGTGVYLQAAPRSKLSRFELSLDVGGAKSTLLQVCDGQRLWTQHDVIGKQIVTSIDVARVHESLQLAPRQATASLPASGLALGGLPRLLQGVQTSFRPIDLQDANLGALPVRVVRAVWRPEKLLHLLSDQRREIEQGLPLDLSKLPDHAPDSVLVYLGRDDLFPYRIEYRRSRLGKDGQPQGPVSTLATMEFYEVQANVQLDVNAFAYDAGAAAKDVTDEFLADRGLPPVAK